MYESYKRNSSNLWDLFVLGRSKFWCAGAYIINRKVLKPIIARVFKQINGWNIVNLYQFNKRNFSPLKADYYIYSMAKTYCLTVPLITVGVGANVSTLHQRHYTTFHQPFFRNQRSLIWQLLSGNPKLPDFVTNACPLNYSFEPMPDFIP